LQREVESLKSAPQAPDVSGRLETVEKIATSILNAMSRSEFLDDSSKASLEDMTSALQKEKDRAELLQELRQEIQPAQQPNELPPEWKSAQAEIVEYAQSKGVDPYSIPQEVFTEGANTGSPFKAVAHVTGWIDEQDESTARIAQRKQAAGKPAPAATQSSSSDPWTIINDWGINPDAYDLETVRKAMQSVGLKVS